MRKRARHGATHDGRPPRHLLADLWDCPADLLRDAETIRTAMLEAARRAGATVVDSAFHRFAGGGITGVVAVRESHLTIHTWPERGWAAVDVFLCGRCDPQVALEHLTARLRAGRATVRSHARGERVAAAPAAAPAARRSLVPLYALTAVVALCSIVYELLLAQTLSALLGNTVLRYSVTIGCFLGALGLGAILCGDGRADTARRLVRVELALSALGGLAVPLFCFLDVVRRFVEESVPTGSIWETLAPLGFLAATHVVIVAIGLLSGFEVPLLLALGEEDRPRSTNRLLGVDYFGALLGSLLFPLFLLRSLGLFATAFTVALLNAGAALALVVWRLSERRLRFAAAGAAIAAALGAGLARADGVEQYFLKKLYYAADTVDSWSLLAPQPHRPRVARHRSAYQTIDLVRDAVDEQWVYDALSAKPHDPARFPRDLWLYIDHEYQVFSGVEEIYHEWFVHAPVQAAGAPPRRALVLGGGDGLAVREILKYDTVERVVHVELDPVMLRLAAVHPLLSAMNGHALDDPRVERVLGDAFAWLRTADERFDAVWIDMPFARDYDRSLVYSREFYRLVRERLGPGGFVALDTPGGWCRQPRNLWDVYLSTLSAAGFAQVVPLVTRIDTDGARFAAVLDRIAPRIRVGAALADGRTVAFTPAQTREYLVSLAAEELATAIQEFVLARPEARPLDTRWKEFGVPLWAFGPEYLADAFDRGCPATPDPDRVNTVFRPTLPPLDLPVPGLL